MLLELFSFVNFSNAMAFVYAYIQCLDGPVNWFSLTFCILIQVFLLLTVTLRGYLISIAYCLFFIKNEFDMSTSVGLIDVVFSFYTYG